MMMRIWLFIHLLGFTMWLGGALAAMVSAIASKREHRSALGPVARTQAAVHKALIGPGAFLTVLSGLALSFSMGELAGFSMWLVIMQATGLVGALVVLLIAIPTAVKLSRVEPTGPSSAYFDELRQRQRVIGSVAGVLGLVALLAGAMIRYGG